MTTTHPAAKRVLFVDDEDALLDLYRIAFEKEQQDWDVEFAPGAPEALEKMETEPFDVVVTDMRMPAMSGAELVVEVMKRHPRTSRLILSGYADQEQVARCIGATHQFIAKPVGLKALRATICRVCSLDTWLGDEKLRALVSQLRTVPSLPSLYFRINEALANPDTSIEEIAAIVQQDPAMTAKILQLVNSAFFGIARRITSPVEAVQFLGVGRLRSLVLSLHVFSSFDEAKIPNFSIEKVWSHSINAGLVAQQIARLEKLDRASADEIFVATMLHDIGKVMLASSLPDLYQEALQLSAARGIPPIEAEREVFGVGHSEVGAYLLGLWGLPVAIVEAIALHHEPSKSGLRAFSPLTVAHVANALEKEINDPDAAKTGGLLDEHYLAELDKEPRLDAWRDAALDALRK
jgi:putative nucleotidyltransferase with HDIG domain